MERRKKSEKIRRLKKKGQRWVSKRHKQPKIRTGIKPSKVFRDKTKYTRKIKHRRRHE